MRTFTHILWIVLIMISCGCARHPSETPLKTDALSEYHLLLIEYDGPSVGAGLAGWEVLEVDLPNSRIRLLQKRVVYTYFTNGIPPDVPPYNIESLKKAICDAPWQPLPDQEASSLHTLIDAWVETTPPAKYEVKDHFGWPGHTTITIQRSNGTVASEMACRYFNAPFNEDTGALREMLFRLSYLTNLCKEKGTQQDESTVPVKAAPSAPSTVR
jgi:hypothetical protein